MSIKKRYHINNNKYFKQFLNEFFSYESASWVGGVNSLFL